MSETRDPLTFGIALLVVISLFGQIAYPVHGSDSEIHTQDAEIHIEGDDDFADKAEEYDWPGEGTEEDPYIIEGYEMEGGTSTFGFHIENTTVHFSLEDCTITGFEGENDEEEVGIYLRNVENGLLKDNEFSQNDVGIVLDQSSENEIENNFLVDHSDAGVVLGDSVNNILKENTASNNTGIGIGLVRSSNNEILGNDISANYGEAINLQESSENIFEDNYMWDPEGGITLTESSTHNEIRENHWVIGEGAVRFIDDSNKNHVENNRFEKVESVAVFIRFSEENVIIGNTFEETGLTTSSWAIELYEEGNNNHIEDNEIIDGKGRGVRIIGSSDGNHITGNTISGNDHWGIEVRDSDENHFEDNEIDENDKGILFRDSQDVSMRENSILGTSIRIEGDSKTHWNSHDIDETNTVNGYPIYYKNQDGGTISEQAGQIILGGASGVTVRDQEMSEIPHPVTLGFSDENMIESNTLSDSHMGVYLFFSEDNTLKENRLHQNEYGVYLDNSSQNLVYHNDFIENEHQAYDNGVNSWDNGYPIGGNYWSDYHGEDHRHGEERNEWGSDGLGDTSYRNIEGDPEEVDSYPLMEPVPTPHVRIDSPESDQRFNKEEIEAEGGVWIEWTSQERFTEALEHEVTLDDDDWINVDEETSHLFEDIEEGDHDVRVRVKDEEENQAVDNVKFTIDTTLPSLDIKGPTDGDFIPQDSVSVEWIGSDDVSGIDRYEIRLNDEEWLEVDTETDHTFEDLDEGEHTVEVKAYDLAGNEVVESVSFTIDTQKPEIDIEEPLDGAVFNEDSITVEWEVTPMGTEIVQYEVNLNDDGWGPADSETSHDFEELSEGENRVEVRITDQAEHEALDEIMFIVDTTPPEVDIVIPEDVEFTEGSVTVEWKGSSRGTEIKKYEIRLDDGEWKTADGPTAHTFQDLTEGQYEMEVRVTDRAGNTHIESMTFEVEAEEDLPLGLIILIVLVALIGGVVFIYIRKKGTSESDIGEESGENRVDENTCSDCGSELSFVPNYNQWYCEECEEYKISEEE